MKRAPTSSQLWLAIAISAVAPAPINSLVIAFTAFPPFRPKARWPDYGGLNRLTQLSWQ